MECSIEVIDIHSDRIRKTNILALCLVSAIMVFVSCDKVLTESAAEAQDTAFSMGTAITSTLYGKDENHLEENLEKIRRCLDEVDSDISDVYKRQMRMMRKITMERMTMERMTMEMKMT